MVIQAFDHCLYVNIKDQLFALKEVPVRKEVSKELDIVAEKNKSKRVYVPPLSHPWKQTSHTGKTVLIFDYFWDIFNIG